MPDTNIKKERLVEGLPELRQNKIPPVDSAFTAELVESILQGGPKTLADLFDGLDENDNGSDWKTRLVVHAVVNTVAAPRNDAERSAVAKVLLDAASGARPAPVRAFLVQQLRLIADKSVVSGLVPLLADGDATVADAAAAALVSVGKPARGPLQAALKGSKGRHAELIEHALLQIG